MAGDNYYNDIEDEPTVRRAKGGIFVSKTAIILYSCLVVAIIVAEGLLIGLVGRPDCDVKAVDTTTKPTQQSTTSATGTESTTSAGPTEPWSNIRLPANLIPDDYVVDLRPVLEPDSDGKYWFYGTSTVRYHCKIPTKYVIIHSNKLEISNDKITLTMQGQPVAMEKIEFYKPNQYLIVETTEECTKDAYYALTASDFRGELADDLDGLYRSEYDKSNGEHVVIATTQMQATGARKTFPCFDEPALKANFTITLWYRADKQHFAISNMPAESYMYAMFDGQEWNATVFEESVPMCTYLLAMVVSDFSYAENTTSKGVQTKIYGRTEPVEAGEAEYAAQITPQILEYFESYFNVPYPLPKSDQIGVPDFAAGAMENWGLVIYREPYILYNENITTVNYKLFITSIISHELAHQWFGNLVSPAWWDDLWLNEGFATYVSYLGEAAVQPTWQSKERFVTDDLQVAFDVDALTSSRPLVQPVNTPNEISAQFDTISYSKGGSILRMINGFMGEDNFVTGLTNYLNELAYDVATHKDLFQYWADQSVEANIPLPTDLITILETWTLQMGFPVINVEKIDLTVMYTISQEYFLSDPDATPVQTNGSLKYGYQWYVPFTYKSSSKLKESEFETMWIQPGQTITVTEADFFLANINAVGYYRVNYNQEMWTKLAGKLDSDEYTDLPEENRAQLLDDAFILASGKRLDILVPLDMTVYLSREKSYIAWETFLKNIKYFDYMLGRTGVYGTFSNYILEKVVPSLYDYYGWVEDDTSDSALIERMTRQTGIYAACYYNYKPCIANATEKFQMWMKNPDDWSIITATFRSDILCAAIRNGGTKEWNFAWERHNATDNAQWQTSIRYGLACSKDPWILGRYLEYATDPSKIRKQDAIRTMEYVGREEYGRDIAWAFMVNNWDMLVNTFGSGWSFDGLIRSITRRFSTEYDLQLLMDFKESNDDLGTATRALDLAIEQTKVNIKWRADNEEVVTKWFYDNVNNIH